MIAALEAKRRALASAGREHERT